MKYAFEPSQQPSLAIAGRDERFPVHRIYCVGRNYAEHAREMGSDPQREPPFFFAKPADAIFSDPGPLPFPSRSADVHHEIELVVAIGQGGANITAAQSSSCIFGYGVGIDLTRRDLQQTAKDARRPWDTAKGFDYSAPIAKIVPVQQTGLLSAGAIGLQVNGEERQRGDLADMIWSVDEIIAELSTLFRLMPGDLIFTGTPAGVGAVQPGDELAGYIDGVGELCVAVGEPA